MLRSACPLIILLAALGGDGARAQERSQRFTMTPTEGGFVRLDTETGAVSICTRKDGQWACELLPEAQRTLSREIERLQAENRHLEAELRRLKESPGPPAPGKEAEEPPAPPPAPKESFELPTEKDVDQAFDYLERMLRKFRDRLKRLDEAEKPGTPL